MSADEVKIVRPDAPRYARELTPGEETSLERNAVMAAVIGRLRGVIRDAIDNLPDGHPARAILERGLKP